jgi:hypothetical protein
MGDELAAEGFTRLTYEIADIDGGYCRLTVTHDLTGAPGLAGVVGGGAEDQGGGGGWAWVLSDLKSLGLHPGLSLHASASSTTAAAATPSPAACGPDTRSPSTARASRSVDAG